MESFNIGDRVTIKLSNKTGEIVGHYQYKNFPDRFTVRYADSTGVVREDGFEADQIMRAA